MALSWCQDWHMAAGEQQGGRCGTRALEGRFRKETEQGFGFLGKGTKDALWSEICRQEWASLVGEWYLPGALGSRSSHGLISSPFTENSRSLSLVLEVPSRGPAHPVPHLFDG